MQYSLAALTLASLAAAAPKAIPAANAIPDDLKHGSSYANTMGPLTFLYPEVRQWTADQDNIAPCGSNAGVQNRSEFPLDDGFVAFIAKYVSTDVKLSISYKEDPKSQDDFEEFYHGNVSSELHIGHTCFYMPDQPSSINAGDVATIQVIYQNDDEDELDADGAPKETSHNQTFYACSDIKFVEESVFDVSDFALSCFNATDDAYYSESSIQTTSASRDASQVAEISSVQSAAGISPTSAASTATSSSSKALAAAMENPVTGAMGILAVIAAGLL